MLCFAVISNKNGRRPNPSAERKLRKGAGLLVVPANLLVNTLREWHQQIDSKNPGIQMHLLYQATPPRANRNKYIVMGVDGKLTTIEDFAASKEDIEFLQNNTDSPKLAQNANHGSERFSGEGAVCYEMSRYHHRVQNCIEIVRKFNLVELDDVGFGTDL